VTKTATGTPMKSCVRSRLITGGLGPRRVGEHLETVSIEQVPPRVMEVRPALTAAVVLGVLAGSALGSTLNRRVQAGAVRRLFAVLLVAVAAEMFYRALVARG
jgi:hypothetical protein